MQWFPNCINPCFIHIKNRKHINCLNCDILQFNEKSWCVLVFLLSLCEAGDLSRVYPTSLPLVARMGSSPTVTLTRKSKKKKNGWVVEWLVLILMAEKHLWKVGTGATKEKKLIRLTRKWSKTWLGIKSWTVERQFVGSKDWAELHQSAKNSIHKL